MQHNLACKAYERDGHHDHRSRICAKVIRYRGRTIGMTKLFDISAEMTRSCRGRLTVNMTGTISSSPYPPAFKWRPATASLIFLPTWFTKPSKIALSFPLTHSNPTFILRSVSVTRSEEPSTLCPDAGAVVLFEKGSVDREAVRSSARKTRQTRISDSGERFELVASSFVVLPPSLEKEPSTTSSAASRFLFLEFAPALRAARDQVFRDAEMRK